ncbi:MAG: SLC13 family permease, partial [Promethearchaeia archaeon]
VTALQMSGFFLLISNKILKHTKTKRQISIKLVILSVLLSIFLINDITLFIIIPITLNIQYILRNNVKKLLIFEIIAINVGSSLIPIGIHQNLYLWHQWNISFFHFIIQMAPMVLILVLILIFLTFLTFKNEPLSTLKLNNNKIDLDSNLLIISVLFLTIFIIFLELRITIFILPFILIIYSIFFKNVIRKVDWPLIILFIIIFIDFRIISELDLINKLINSLNLIIKAFYFF